MNPSFSSQTRMGTIVSFFQMTVSTLRYCSAADASNPVMPITIMDGNAGKENLTSSLLRYTPPSTATRATQIKGPLQSRKESKSEKANQLLSKYKVILHCYYSSWQFGPGVVVVRSLVRHKFTSYRSWNFIPTPSTSFHADSSWSCPGKTSGSEDEDYQHVHSRSYLDMSTSTESETHDPDKCLLLDEL